MCIPSCLCWHGGCICQKRYVIGVDNVRNSLCGLFSASFLCQLETVGIENYAMLMKSRKRQTTEGIELQNHERIRTLWEKENCEYLDILEVDTVKQAEMKEKIAKEYFKGRRKFLEPTLGSRNLNKGINTWAVIYHMASLHGPFSTL